MFFNNNRYDLNQPMRRTIKFKTLWPTYTQFKTDLLNYNVTVDMIPEEDYNVLKAMCANTYLRYKTEEKNKMFVAFKINELQAIRKREEKLYNKQPEDILKAISENEQKFFTTNRSELGDVTSDFLDNVAKSTITNTDLMIKYIKELKEFNVLPNPKYTYYTRLARLITLPIITTNTMEVF